MSMRGLVTFAILLVLRRANAFSSTLEAANLAKGRLQEALSSPAKKTTISCEIIIPEPSDPTALLLQSTEVTKLSHGIRSKAKGNAAFLSGSVNAIKTFCLEQESARGGFPSPLPVIYCDSLTATDIDTQLEDLAKAGVSGIMYTLLNGDEASSPNQVEELDSAFQSMFQKALDNGIQLIPELVLNSEVDWDEAKMKSIMDSIIGQCGSQPPVALVLSIGKDLLDSETTVQFPKVPKKSPIITLASIRAVAGGGRLGAAVQDCKEAGFNGVVLRCDCLPGFRMNPDLEFVQKFWGAAISDLKSTKSKNFNFRSKVSLDRDIPMEWFNYQKSVMESGALGGPDPGASPLDTENGDYQGF